MLNKNDVLRLTDGGLRVFRHYLNVDFRVGKNFLNPFYKDSKASCNVFYDRHKQLYRMKDFGDDTYSVDCFSFVAKLKGLNCKNADDFIKILSTINRDLNLNLNEEDQTTIPPLQSVSRTERNKPEPPLIQPKVKPYKIARKNFSQKELTFWQQSGDTLFITGGERDVLTLASHSFHAICFNSESSNIPKSIIRKLTYRFKHIVILYDTDKTGLSSSQKHQNELKEFDVKRLLLPLEGTKQEKDISDYFRLGHSREDFLQLFVDYLDSLYAETMAVLKPCEIDFNNPPASVQTIISINDVPLGTQGNLLCITGGEGSGKSNYSASLIAGAMSENQQSVDTLGAFVSPNTQNKAVLLYDTEQSEVQLYKNSINILKRSKRREMANYFKAYCLNGMSRSERLQAIVQSMDKYYYEFGGIHTVVIDGIADLIGSANDEAESLRIVDELYRLAGIYKTCIICVLHFVPNGLKLRGHLGSELQRKAASIISIEKDDDPNISVIKALKVRDGSPLDVPIIQFAWDKEAGMHCYLGEKKKEEKDKRKENELLNVARSIFRIKPFFSYLELAEELQQVMDVRERTAKSYIKFMREKEIIIKDPSNDSIFILGQLK
ncbi:MAG: toprim domain-containing protein [Prevotellaceae bacterium]|jgi:hypothetical protein|nr:toprim domain-containing protein [Prevotellaceae bacterium]